MCGLVEIGVQRHPGTCAISLALYTRYSPSSGCADRRAAFWMMWSDLLATPTQFVNEKEKAEIQRGPNFARAKHRHADTCPVPRQKSPGDRRQQYRPAKGIDVIQKASAIVWNVMSNEVVASENPDDRYGGFFYKGYFISGVDRSAPSAASKAERWSHGSVACPPKVECHKA